MRANAADSANRTYEQLAREILEEAAAVDAAEDERYGEARGDELPPELADPTTRRCQAQGPGPSYAGERPAASGIGKPRAARAELADWQQAKADYTARTGRKLGGPTKPRPVPNTQGRAEGRILTDPDSRPVKTARGFIQGYSAQAVATPEQIIVAAEVTIGGNDRALLGPMITAAASELEQAGITEPPGVVLADAGYWNGPHIDALIARGMQVLPSPRRRHPQGPQPPQTGRPLKTSCVAVLGRPDGQALYRQCQAIIEPGLRPHQDLPPRRPLPAPRPRGLPSRMAAAGRHPQPPQALAPRANARHGLTRHPPPATSPRGPHLGRLAARPRELADPFTQHTPCKATTGVPAWCLTARARSQCCFSFSIRRTGCQSGWWSGGARRKAEPPGAGARAGDW